MLVVDVGNDADDATRAGADASAARRRLSDPVSLGPYTSLSQLSVSITCEFWNPSSLIAAITVSSTRSPDARPLTGADVSKTVMKTAIAMMERAAERKRIGGL